MHGEAPAAGSPAAGPARPDLDPAAGPSAAAAASAPGFEGARAPSLLDIGQQLFDDLRGALQARAHLFALEAQRAGLALVLMAVYGVVAALLLVTAWFCVWTLLIVIAVNLGAPLWLVLLVALLLSVGVAWLLIKMVRVEARYLLFPASVRHIGPERAPAHAAAGAAPAAGAAE